MKVDLQVDREVTLNVRDGRQNSRLPDRRLMHDHLLLPAGAWSCAKTL